MAKFKPLAAGVTFLAASYLLGSWLDAGQFTGLSARPTGAKASGAADVTANMLQSLHVESDFTQTIASIIGLLFVALILVALIPRYRKASPALAILASGDERGAETYRGNERRSYPKEILQNPFGENLEYLSFEQKTDIAIEGGLLVGRYTGVIYLPLQWESDDNTGARPLPAEAALEAFAKMLRAKMRSHDGVALTDRGLIIVPTLMQNIGNLQMITRRVHIAGIKCAGSIAGLTVAEPGAAGYPLDGYTAAELIETARIRSGGTNRPARRQIQDRAVQTAMPQRVASGFAG